MGFSKQWVLSFLLLVAECCCKLWRQPPGMALSDFERCLVYLNEKTANSSVSLYEQKSCIKHAHAGASAESSVTEFCFIGQVGPKVGPPRPMVSSDDLISMKCKIRPIWWRPSFVPVIDPDAGAVHRFLDWLHKQGYSRLILMGDSVTSNTAAHLMCDLARAGYRLNSCPRKYNSRNGADGTVGTGNSCDVVYSRDGSFQITIIAYRLFLPCTERTCHNHVNNSMMSYYSETLHTVKMGLQQTHNSSSSSSSHGDKALAVYNDGLHLMGSDQRLIQTNIAIGVLSLALSLKALNTTLVFRETSAQHFIYSPDGRYWGLKSQHNASLENKYCCSFPEHPRRMDERDETLLRDLRDLDALWFQRVGWAKFYEPTLALFADHVEATSWNSIDCTHFAYRPGGTGLQLLQAIMSAVDNWGIDPTPVELK